MTEKPDEKPDEKPEGKKPEDTKPLGVSETIAAMRKGLADAAETKDEDKDEDKAGGGEGGDGEGEGAEGAEGADAGGEGGDGGEGTGEGDGGEGGGDAEGGEAAEPDQDLIVEIRPRGGGAEPVKVAFEDKETAALVRGALRDGLRRDDFNRAMAKLEAQREEFELLDQHLKLDPVGFLLDRVRPELKVDLAKNLFYDPEVSAALSTEIEESGDENVRARRQAELSKGRSEARRDVEQHFGEIRAAKEQARMVHNAIETITPIDMDDDEAVLFDNDCRRDVAQWIKANPEDRRLRPEEIVTILEKRLRYHGVKPESALAALSSGQPFRRAAAARPKKGAPAPGTSDLEAARTTGAKLREAGKARRDAAAVPGAGAGAQVTKLQPPPKQGVKERIAWLKQKLAR